MARREQFFHGTRFDIQDRVVPGGKAPHRNWFGEDNPHEKAFATTDEHVAWDYAGGDPGWGFGAHPERRRVYEVAPSAKREPGRWNTLSAGHSGHASEDMHEWMAPSWKVRRRIDVMPGRQGTFPQLNWKQFANTEGPNKVQQGDVNHPTHVQVERGHGMGGHWEKYDGTPRTELPGQQALKLDVSGHGGRLFGLKAIDEKRRVEDA